MAAKLFVGNFPYDTQEGKLRTLFEDYGDVIELRIVRKKTGESRGFGFVTYDHIESAERALQSLHGRDVNGRPLRVDHSVARHSRDYNNNVEETA